MPSGKLHLKRTPAEQAERDWRKAQKAARKAANKRHYRDAESSNDERESSSKRRRTVPRNPDAQHTNHYPYVFYDSDNEYGPSLPPSSSASSSAAHKPDYDHIRAQLEEERFREKMFGAMEEDERLDGLESHLNAYAHVPRRWRSGGMDRMDDELDINPQMMEDEDYAEWIRAGMWRRKHAEEYAEHERKQAERAARHARENAVRDETARLEKALESDRRRRHRSRERRQATEAREFYDVRWKQLLSAGEDGSLRFSDIPWPVMPPGLGSRKSEREMRSELLVEHLTVQAISAFLTPANDYGNDGKEEMKKERKEKLRETMLRFHPDKFEGRIMRQVKDSDREMVREAVGLVVRTVSDLMGDVK